MWSSKFRASSLLVRPMPASSAPSLSRLPFKPPTLTPFPVSVSQLRAVGFSASALRAAKFSVAELSAAGYTITKEVGYTAKELSLGGFGESGLKVTKTRILN